MHHKKTAIAFITFIMFFLPICNIVHGATEYCLDNSTLRTISDYTINGSNVTQFNITKDVPCPYGCQNNECMNSSSSNWVIGLYIIGGVLLVTLIVWWFLR